MAVMIISPKYGLLLPHGCVTVSVVQNRLAAMSFSKDDFHIIDHIEYILTGLVARLGQVVCLPFKMLAYLSYGVICRKKSTMAKVHDLSTFFKNTPLISPKQCVHALYPLFDCPERLLRAGQSLIVTKQQCSQVKVLLFVLIPHTYTWSVPQK